MELGTLLNPNLVQLDFAAANKDDVIRGGARMMYEAGKVTDKDEYVKALYQRESEFETGIGMGVAIPHCKNECVKEAAFALIKLEHEIEWGSLDGQPVRFVIMLAAPDSSDNVHLKLLSQLARNLMDDQFRETLVNAKDFSEIKKLFEKED